MPSGEKTNYFEKVCLDVCADQNKTTNHDRVCLDICVDELKKNTNHDKVCLNAPACERAWIYERALGYMLEGHDDRVIGEVIPSNSSSSLPTLSPR